MTMRGIVITDSAKGEFSASPGASREDDGTAYLRRRVRSAEPWELDRGVGTPHVWSTAGFDWMCGVFLGTLEPDGLARLQRQLHPGEPVVGAPTGRTSR